MKLIVSAALAAAQLAVAAQPAFAADLQGGASAVTGTFGGLRLRVPLDGRRNEAPRLGIAFAPTVHMPGDDGSARMRIGEGLEFGISGRRQTLALSIAGRRLGAQDGGRDGGGIDTAEGILIGAGVIVVGLAVFAVVAAGNQNDDNI